MNVEAPLVEKSFELSTFLNTMVVSYIEITPIIIVGLIAGLLNCFHNNRWSKYEFFKGILTSCFLALVVYGLLIAVDIPYLTRVSIAGIIGFLGFENSLDFIERVLNIVKNHRRPQ